MVVMVVRSIRAIAAMSGQGDKVVSQAIASRTRTQAALRE